MCLAYQSGSTSKYLEQLDNLSENKINHMIDGSKNSNHGWEKLVPDKNWSDIKNIIADYQNIFKTELKISDPGVKITITKKDITNKWLDREMAFRLIRLIYVLPHGVFAWSQDIPDFVETSTNLASIKKQDEHYIITTSQRSSLESAKENICNKVK